MLTLFTNAIVYRNGCFVPSEILLEDGLISAISEPGAFDTSDADGKSVRILDLKGKYIFPGFSDVHVHFREPGFFYKESIKTGSMAAAAGGYTDVCTMPNLKPVPDSAENLKQQTDIIEKDAVIRVHPYGSLSRGEAGNEASDIDGMEMCENAPIAYSDDGVGLVSDELMKHALEMSRKYNKIIAAHCEYKSLMGGSAVNAGPAAEALGINGISDESEWRMIERDLKLLKEYGGRYHVCHVSTKESVELIRKAKADGLDVTCETGPHYLILNDDDVAAAILEDNGSLEQGCSRTDTGDCGSSSLKRNGIRCSSRIAGYGIGRLKMNPPIRSEEDRRALINGVLDGTIDMIATDHAPHGLDEKNKGMIDGPMGVAGLECAFPVCYTYLVKTGVISLEKLIELMSSSPARRFGFDNSIEVGKKANFSVFDLDAEYTVDPDGFRTKGRFTPFDGWQVSGKCKMTVCDGKVVFEDDCEK